MFTKTFDSLLAQPKQKISNEQIKIELDSLFNQIKQHSQENKSYQRMCKDIRALWHICLKIKNHKMQGFEEITSKSEQLINNSGKIVFENTIKTYQDLIEFLKI